MGLVLGQRFLKLLEEGPGRSRIGTLPLKVCDQFGLADDDDLTLSDVLFRLPEMILQHLPIHPSA